MHVRFPFRRRTKPGASPGTVMVDPSAPKPVIRLIAFGPDIFLERVVENLGELEEIRANYPIVWIDLDALGDAAIIHELGAAFGLHSLALEDVVNSHQRAKVEEYEDHLFIVARMVDLNGRFETEQISLFLGENFVLTFQERPGDCLEPVRDRLRKSRGKIRNVGADYLAYALLDAVVDGYFPVLERLDEKVNTLELEVANAPAKELFQQIHELRGDLVHFKRTVWPHLDLFRVLSRDPGELIKDETRIYLRDCYDHTVQIVELVETYREACSHLQDLYINALSQRMNEIMKVLTIFATIFMPMSFIASVYGMNFDTDVSMWNMPELHWVLGYPFSLTLMAAVAAFLMLYFWRKGWLS